MTNTDTVIQVSGLRKHYGGVPAVDGIDLVVRRGEIFAVLGPNGAGKTTTVEILEGYRRRDAGEVRVLGEDPASAGPRWRSRVGVVLQEASDAAELTVGEMLRHFARYYPRPRDPREVCAQVGLSEKWGSRIRSLSGGQRRRLDVALGILGHPELVFLDEPTTGFDPRARRRFWDLIRMLAGEGTTVLLTTHYLDEAEALADRVAVIARGRVLETAAPAELGGRARAEAVVRWGENGGEHSRRTPNPTALVLELAHRYDGEIPGLSIHRPTLEDVYLRLIEPHQDEQAAADNSAPEGTPS